MLGQNRAHEVCARTRCRPPDRRRDPDDRSRSPGDVAACARVPGKLFDDLDRPHRCSLFPRLHTRVSQRWRTREECWPRARFPRDDRARFGIAVDARHDHDPDSVDSAALFNRVLYRRLVRRHRVVAQRALEQRGSRPRVFDLRHDHADRARGWPNDDFAVCPRGTRAVPDRFGARLTRRSTGCFI